MVRQLVLKFGDDWTTICYSFPYPSMLNLVSLYVVFTIVGVGGQMTKFNIEVYGQLYEIMLQSSPNFNISCRTIYVYHKQNLREIESNVLKYKPKTRVVHETCKDFFF